jgi:glycosyltransferase involved in cell wall biosynthesis
MRIAIDGRTIQPRRSGVGQYAEFLVRSLLKIDRENNYILFLAKPNDTLEAPNLTKILIEGYERMILNRVWENLILPRYVQTYSIDLYFSPAFALPVLPRLGRCIRWLPLPWRIRRFCNADRKLKYVVTIHDLIAYIHPEYFTPKMRMWTKLFVPNALKLADKVIVVSDTTKRDLMKLFGVESEKVKVVWPWFDEKFHPVTDPESLAEVRERYSLPPKFILYLGTIEPRKNIVGLAEAYSLLPPHIQHEFSLVLAGGMGWYADTIVAQLQALHTHGSVTMVDYVEDRHLPALYSLASLFAFPSFYEGFGSPPLEAMSCGTPVITSNVSAIPDVVGDAALLVNPHDVREISAAMEKVLSDGDLQSTLRERGFERLKLFDQRKNAKDTLAVFESVMA